MKNIKVGAKLAFGFGLVLLLTAVLALSNTFNLNKVISQSDNAFLTSQIVEQTQALQITSLGYELQPSAQATGQVQALVRSIQQNVQQVQAGLTLEKNIQLVGEIAKVSSEYEQAFANFVRVHQQKASNLETIVNSGARSDALVVELSNSLNGQASTPRVHADFAAALAGRRALELLQERRNIAYLARIYLMEETEQRMQAVEQAYSQFESMAEQLTQSLSAHEAQALLEARERLADYMQHMRQMPGLVQALQDAKRSMDRVSARIQTLAETVLASQNTVRQAGAVTAKNISAAIALFALAFGLLIGLLIARQITQPLSQAVTIAQTIGNRDLTGQGVEARRDEFGVLLAALDQTRTNLRGALGEVSGFTTQLAAAAEQLSAVTLQTSAGVNSQREETEQVATAMNEMTATVHEVAHSAEVASSAVEKANGLAVHGEQVLQSALEANNRLTAQVQQSALAMQRLNEDSTNISTVLVVINGIAEQTNLLALNAAIEAARAGEAGRGFAVVADEVRNLAQRTQESTAQIEELIANLQEGSGNAVTMMDNSRNLADATLELVEEAGNELQAIVRVMGEIQAMGMQIATASEEQTSVAEEINRSVVNVNNIADQSAAAVEETAASSAELARLGQELQGLVRQFKLA